MGKAFREFLRGAGSVLDIFGEPPPDPPIGEGIPRAKTAMDALRGDMERLGGDFWTVIRRHEAGELSDEDKTKLSAVRRSADIPENVGS